VRIVVDDAIAAAEPAFAPFGSLVRLPGRAIVPGLAELREAEALIVRSITRVDDRLLAEAPKLRFVGTATAGTDHLDLAALARRGIVVADAAGCNAQAVAEWVVVALLHVLPSLPETIARGPLGVVGVGQVGSRLVKLVRRLGLFDRVLCCDPPRARRGHLDEEWIELDELWERCSIVSLHVPLIASGSDATVGLIDRDHPKPAEPKLLINTSRGAVVTTQALARPDVHARVLDVYEHEPELDFDVLLDGRSLLLSPHVAGYSLEAKLRATSMMHAALARWLGQPISFDAIGALPDLRLESADLPTLLHRIVDQPGDDHRVRALIDLPPSERAAAFEQLRRGYALRREFAGCVIEGDEQPSFAALGLRTIR
jgi:erythronate-4-phosphate dehydrogenase